jgi:hypothetical protein
MLNITDHIFYPLDGNFKKKLINRLQASEIDFINELATLAQKYSLTSGIIDNKMIWKDQNNAIQLILHFNIKAHELNKILDIYRYTRHHQEIQNFILIDQTNPYKQAYDIFRLTRLSFMQHCNHFRIRMVEHSFNNFKSVQPGAIFTLFGPLKPGQKYRWGRIFAYQETVKVLERECDRNNLKQAIEEEFIFWTDKQDHIKCMFTVVYDSSNIDTFIKIYLKIIEKNIRLTYCIVNQFPDGRYEFDIFRLSEMSYLEHYNRVRPSSKDLYHLMK